MTTNHMPEDVLATVKSLRARLRKVAPTRGREGAHLQIAKRRIADAAMFAHSNTEYAVACCWEARFHLNHCE
jgi:hypothetical protein